MTRLLMVALLTLACVKVGPPPIQPPPPDAVVDASPQDQTACQLACAHGAQIGCDTSPRCVPTCENVQSSGVFTYDAACLARARDCAAWRACFP